MAHPMAGYDAAKVHEVLDIPEDYHVMCMISLGYEGGVELLDDQTRKKDEAPRKRKDMNEIVAFDKFDF
jgi:nitroreductase